MRDIGHFIAGAPVPPGGCTGPVHDPATGEVIARVALGSAADVDAAVAAARAAQPDWRRRTAQQRARVMFRFRELMEARRDELALAITREHGKTLADAAGEVRRGIDVVEFACGAPRLLCGEHSDDVGGGIDNWSLREPVGVAAGITPYNFPVMVPLWMAPLALVCGNAFVLKPSDRDPGPTLLLAELWREAGLPAGLFNVVNGDAATAAAVVAHPGIDAVSFVGSTPAAREVYAAASRAGKRVQALGGAKNHLVVMPDADLDAAADALAGAAWGSAGQRCMAISVAVAVGNIGDALVEALAARARALRVGPGTGAGIEMGPLITAAHRERVEGFIARGVEEGARLVVDGRGFTVPGHPGGFFTGPTLFDRVTTAMAIHREEIFGPVLCVARAPDLAAAVAMINAHPLANGAAVFTADGATARAFARGVEIGMVGINVPIPVPMAWMSFGGWKASMHGDLNVYGDDGLRFYTRRKSVMQRWPRGRGGPEYTMPTGG